MDFLFVCRKRPGPTRRSRDDITRRDIPALVCEHKRAHCGYEGRKEYECEPRTKYQKDARQKETADLQHFTKTVKARKVDRYVFRRWIAV
jgi:DNA (cytosine-5)-methyltransferase 1